MNDSSGNELIVTFKGFDFLDNELNEESEVRLSALTLCLTFHDAGTMPGFGCTDSGIYQ